MGRNLKVDSKRQPYIYSVAPDAPEITQRENIDKAKKAILNKEETNNPVIQLTHQYRRELLSDMIPALEAVSIAIQELERDGLLVDTLSIK
jgi:hypothetical protein